MDTAVAALKPETLDQLVEQIELQHASMPKRLREIVSFALGHPEAIALSTLSELAAETDIATSAFVRFAQTLGFDGFSQMHAVFRQQVRSSWPQYSNRLSEMAEVDTEGHFEALPISAVESINRLSKGISLPKLEAACQAIADAETVWLAASGRAKPVKVYKAYEQGVSVVGITDTSVSPVALGTTLLVSEENLFGFQSLCATMNLAQYLAIEAGLKRKRDGGDD